MKAIKTEPNQTTYSQRRAKQLLQRSEKIGKMFNINNFYDNNHINVDKLREKINQAKKKLFLDRQKQMEKQKLKLQSRMKQISKSKSKSKDQVSENGNFIKNKSLIKTEQDNLQLKNLPFNQLKTKRCVTRGQHKSRIVRHQRIVRIATELGDYHVGKKNSIDNNQSRLRTINNQTLIKFKTIVNTYQNQNARLSSVDTPTGKNTRSVSSFQIENKRIIIKQNQEMKQFQMKLVMLWELYEIIVQLMQQTSKSPVINQKLVIQYIKQVNSQKFQFVHQIYELFPDIRVERTIKLSRLLENFSIFEMCLSSISRKKSGSSQIINYLGYSSSSVIFLIKIMLLTHEINIQFSQHVQSIVQSIVNFQINSYKTELKNIKQVLRRLEHNNQIIGMIKTRCGKKHGKYCEQFIVKMIKSVEKLRTPFYECANNIFQFLAFYLHYQNIANNLPLLSTPPSPFLSLAYSKTIIIQPWGVLAYKKNNKLVIRAHAGKFLAQISDNCNIIFWTQFMPKDADILTNLFPVKDNIYWLYRYHCRQQKQTLIKMIDLVGCLTQNTIVIDNHNDHFIFNNDIGISMPWTGEKKDVKLLRLSQIIQSIFSSSNANKTTLKEQLQNVKQQLLDLNSRKNHKNMKYQNNK